MGSGNWGSAIAKIIGSNVVQHVDKFAEEVSMWVFEEMVEGRKLTEIINETHENVKYLPQKNQFYQLFRLLMRPSRRIDRAFPL